jgi:hypothetical protein
MKANLPNYRVEFHVYSEYWQGGISSIVEMPGELVQGDIYETQKDENQKLDILERVSDGLGRRLNSRPLACS